MGQQVLGTDKVLRMNNYSLLAMVQSEDWQPNFNGQDVMQMGDTGRVARALELETSGTFEVEATGNLAGLLARMQVARDAGTGAFTGFVYDGATSKNEYTLTQDDMREMQFDLLMHERTDQVNFDRSVWLPRLFLTTFSGRVDANGMASETVNFAGQSVVSLPAPYHDARSLIGTLNAGEITLEDAGAYGPVDATTHDLVYVYIDEHRYRSADAVPLDATYFTLGTGVDAGKLTMTTTEGTVIPAKAVIRALVTKKAVGASKVFQSPTDFGTSARYVKGYQATIFLAPQLDVNGEPVLAATDKWLKVQNADFSVDLRTEVLRQVLANKEGTSIYCRVPTFPLDCTVNVSTYESDLTDWKKMMKSAAAGGGVYDAAAEFAPSRLKDSFAVVFVYYTTDLLPLQQITFYDMALDSAPHRANVGGRGEVSFGLKGTKFKIVGTDN